jgi:uncharacterized membrane protein YfcA
MLHEPLQYLLGGASGVLVGFVLGLVGGGGSILAVPLLVYVVGVTSPHLAIGTSALAVAINAAAGLWNHARRGNVKWRCSLLYAGAGVCGAYGGSTLGKAVDGQRLLALFAVLMLVVAVLMFRGRGESGDAGVRLSRDNAPKLLGFGLATGVLSGFFGIGGGFLVVPGLIAATGMPMLYAVGSSLVAVTAFGLTTAANYARSGWIDVALAAAFVLGGLLGSRAGAAASTRLAARKGALNVLFGGVIVLVALYVLYRSLGTPGAT